MSEIVLQPAFVLALLTEVSRHRALIDGETDVIEDILAMEIVPFRWNPRMDNALLLAAHSKGGIARFARRHGITGGTAYTRLFRLRQKHKADARGAKVLRRVSRAKAGA